MFASLVVVSTAGMAKFGVYSFIFVLTTLAGAFLSTLLHRQMTLHIASSADESRRQVFLATLLIQTTIICIALLACFLLMVVFSKTSFVDTYRFKIIAAVVFVGVFNTYELCRQYLYVLDEQSYSLRCTVLYAFALALGFLVLYLRANEVNVVAYTYFLFAASLLVSLLANRRCQNEIAASKRVTVEFALSTFAMFFDQGRFRIVGMLVTWLQNQSMNPFLMWASGPLAAGYFSMARLLVMPIAVVTQGLTNSTIPRLRRMFQSAGTQSLKDGIKRYSLLNLAMAAVYLTALGIAQMTGILERFVPSYSEVRVYLLIWVVTLLVTMLRYWLGELFVIRMQFRFLMKVSIVAAVVSVSGMIMTVQLSGNVYLALLFVVVGELLSIGLFLRVRNKPVPEEHLKEQQV